MSESLCKKCRRAGQKLYLKGERCLSPKCAFTRRSYIPGQHGPKSRTRLSDYGKQLREKQKAQAIYNITANQLKKYFQKASKNKEATNEVLMQALELRFDNILYRLNLADSRRQARTMIKDGHFCINNIKNTVPGRKIKISEKISLRKEKGKLITEIKEKIKNVKTARWLELDKSKIVGEIKNIPTRDQIDADIDESLIIEYFSR